MNRILCRRPVLGVSPAGSSGGPRPVDPGRLEVALVVTTTVRCGLRVGRRCTTFEFVGAQGVLQLPSAVLEESARSVCVYDLNPSHGRSGRRFPRESRVALSDPLSFELHRWSWSNPTPWCCRQELRLEYHSQSHDRRCADSYISFRRHSGLLSQYIHFRSALEASLRRRTYGRSGRQFLVSWGYVKDSSERAGADAGWIDEVRVDGTVYEDIALNEPRRSTPNGSGSRGRRFRADTTKCYGGH